MRWMLVGAFVATAACGGAHPTAAPSTPTPTGAPAGGGHGNDALIARGGALYGEHCAKCHGDAGQGTDKAPPVVGVATGALPLVARAGAKRTVPFHTAADVGGWVAENMPGNAPGTLQLDEYVAILAFDLHANGVDLGDEPFTLERAKAIVIHP